MQRAAAIFLGSVVCCGGSALAAAAVTVVSGPTPIQGGEARAAGDITVTNEHLAFAIAVQTPPPYGVPRGALIDIAAVEHGQPGRDRVVFADFIPNNWSAWPNTYQRVVIEERSADRAVLSSSRDWGSVDIKTTYTLERDSDRVLIHTTMTNRGTSMLANLLSGQTLWPKGGFLFGVPGVKGDSGPTAGALANRVVAYDERGFVALHAPYADHIGYGSKDMDRLHSLAPGARLEFDAFLQVGSTASLQPVVLAEIDRNHSPSGTLRGRVVDRSGRAVADPVIVVELRGKPYAWMLGSNGDYRLTLPAGTYQLYATAKDYAQSQRTEVTIASGVESEKNFADLEPPARLLLAVSDAKSRNPLDARVSIQKGQTSTVEFLGRKTFFTALESPGVLDTALAPGAYEFKASADGGFLSAPETLSVDLSAGASVKRAVQIVRMFEPAKEHWYSADLHHHADQAEAVTPPAELARSQLAAGLDLLFVSDHDSTVNHATLQKIAVRRRVPFIAAIELSPSWGHFNAYPLQLGLPLGIDTGTATVQQVFAEARRQGAQAIQVNHPYIPYGYFSSVAAGVAPGGFDGDFDLVEINAAVPADDTKVLSRMASFWDAGRRYYLSAGTDTHDVWNDESGEIRVFAHVDDALDAASFVRALKGGNSYVTRGPLLFPRILFGATVGAAEKLRVSLRSVAGLKSAWLWNGGHRYQIEEFPAAQRLAEAEFAVPEGVPWVALIVEDRIGNKAYANPWWIRR